VAAHQLEDQARLGVPAIIIAGLALAAGLSATTGTYDSGIRFDVQDGKVVVAEVEHLSQAERDGVHPGLVAVSLNGLQLIQLPEPRYAEPDPNDPDAPIVVLGYHAKVTADAASGPVPMYWGQPARGAVPVVWGAKADEWSGSTTGPENPEDRPPGCKAAAQWSFALGCGFTVSEGQLAFFTHPEPARGLQRAPRLSPLRNIIRPK